LPHTLTTTGRTASTAAEHGILFILILERLQDLTSLSLVENNSHLKLALPKQTAYYFAMQRSFSWKITITCSVLALGMVTAAIWQWDRHLWKIGIISQLEQNLRAPVVPLTELLSEAPGSPLAGRYTFRRVRLSGTFDFEHETILRNRRLNDRAGVHVITPLKLSNSDTHVLVDRGFLPLGMEGRETRAAFQNAPPQEFFGLIKESMPTKLLAPSDGETGPGLPWIDQWLRVDIERMKAQLPYLLLPIYAETMTDPNDPSIPSQIVKESSGGRNEVLMYAGQRTVDTMSMLAPNAAYPIPTFDTTPPADIHLGYVWEWSFMALLTTCIGVIAQLPRPKRAVRAQPPPQT